ncbi:hypothetical protein I0C86_03710 [Plantactinospora sp. S1510]|uniref:Acetoacetate decarboxylase n=1 Tax=Plantactinospora alkalitolerans TaxID=2789879 RepID=A0ABS0GPI3_9ACTN|nr:hypothetical protein [Plantactinospora alkalitolerans]MBF9128102.1 hypothetical protein [Plantactinospora alkalitolerans]
MSQLVPPQLVVQCRMLHFGWIPADPEAVARLLPSGLRPMATRQVFMHQYVVDDDAQTSGLDTFSATCLGPELDQVTSADLPGPSRWYAQHISSSPAARAGAAARGAPVGAGRTSLEIDGRTLVAVTEVDGVEVIRTTARVGPTGTKVLRGHIRYLGAVGGRQTAASCPYVFEPVTPFEVESLEFLAPEHPVFALRPANPLEMLWGFYSPRTTFAFPGSE